MMHGLNKESISIVTVIARTLPLIHTMYIELLACSEDLYNWPWHITGYKLKCIVHREYYIEIGGKFSSGISIGFIAWAHINIYYTYIQCLSFIIQYSFKL